MYNEYFGLRDSPFSIAPNPQYLYMSERHREALAHLLYGIRSDGGFILLTGEVGTGKTTVCRCLLDQVPEDVDVAFILNPKLTAVELLGAICDDFGLEYPAHASVKPLIDRLNKYLLDSHAAGRQTVLIIDEAQNLSSDVLEQLRLLTNLETNERKLLQIILLGQPELLDILDKKELRQLSQRITARFHLDELSRDEVKHYIDHRLEVAGARTTIFRSGAVKRVFQLSQGVPRIINLICDRALLGAYAEGREHVTAAMVDHAAKEVFGNRTRESGHALAIAASIVILAATAAIGTWYWRGTGELQMLAQLIPGNTPPAAEPLVQDEPATVEPETAAPSVAETAVEPVTDTIVTAVVGAKEPPSTDSLIDLEGDANEEAALLELFELWDLPIRRTGPALCEQAKRFDTDCLTILGSLRDLRHIDRPAVVRLNIASIDHHFVVTGFDGDIVELSSSEGQFRLMPRDFLRSWDGNFAVLWRPPPGPATLTRGDRGDGVDWLRTQLGEVEGNSDVQAGQPFDRDLERRLRQFQMSVGLKPDGIAGTNTWLYLERETRDVPRLTRAGNEAGSG